MNSLLWFRKGEFRSVLVILFLGIIVVILQRWREYQLRPEPLSASQRSLLFAIAKADSLRFASAMDQAQGSGPQERISTTYQSESKHHTQENIAKAKRKAKQNYTSKGPFDPNVGTDEDWLSRGLTEKQLQILRNFQQAGGQFHSALDLRKIYGWNAEWVEECIAEVELPNKPLRNDAKVDKILTKVDLNRCDTTDLKRIKGIGSYYAKKVIGYREALGGYVSLDQLGEIYHMRDEALAVLMENTTIRDSSFCSLRINSCDREHLKNHPYIPWKIANNVVAFREMHGKYETVNDLLKTAFIDDETLAKLKPYLCLDD